MVLLRASSERRTPNALRVLPGVAERVCRAGTEAEDCGDPGVSALEPGFTGSLRERSRRAAKRLEDGFCDA